MNLSNSTLHYVVYCMYTVLLSDSSFPSHIFISQSPMTSTPRRNVRRFTLVFILAFTSAFVALSTLERNDSIVPLAPYKVFVSSQDKRGLSTSTTPTEEALRPFNHEVPFQKSATFLIGIFSSNSGKYSNRRSYIRDTYLSSEDPRICKLSEYMR